MVHHGEKTKKASVGQSGIDPSWKSLVVAQTQAVEAFEKIARQSLAPVLGTAG
jgi:hypothetical protein